MMRSICDNLYNFMDGRRFVVELRYTRVDLSPILEFTRIGDVLIAVDLRRVDWNNRICRISRRSWLEVGEQLQRILGLGICWACPI